MKLAIVGATGQVGQTMLECVYKSFRNSFNNIDITLYASEKSDGKIVNFNDKKFVIKGLNKESIDSFDYALFSAGGNVSKLYAENFTEKGAIVIDNSSAFRMDKDVPLVIPEINAYALDDIPKKIVANPNCSTIQMLMVLEPIRRISRIKKIVVSTYQAVSGAGHKGINEMENQLINKDNREYKVFPHPICFNVIPQIGKIEENGFTEEELKMINETHKIFNDYEIIVEPTTVRVPVLNGHSEAVYFETEEEIDLKDIIEAIKSFHGVIFCEHDYPIAENISGKNEVYCGRLRKSLFNNKGYHIWIVGDNLLKGAALNAVQIMEKLIEKNRK